MRRKPPSPSVPGIALGIIVARAVLCLSLALIVAGLVAAFAGVSISTSLLAAGCGVLLAGPVLNVMAELADEVRQRDWPFAAAAAVVLALIVYTAIRTIW